MKKKILILLTLPVILASILIVSFLYRLLSPSATKVVSVIDGKIGIDNIEMKIPENWYFLEPGPFGDIYIRTDYKPYNVDLVLDYSKNNKTKIEDYKINSSGFDYVKIPDGEIFKIPWRNY